MCRVKATVAGDSRLAVYFDFYNFTGRRSFEFVASIVMSLISRKYLCTNHFCEVCISRLAWTVSCADILILIISLVDYFKEAFV